MMISSTKPWLARDGSHYLITEKHLDLGRADFGGRQRNIKAFVKIWVPIPPKERREEVLKKKSGKVI